MAKQTITDETVAECVSMARDAAREAQAIANAINKINVNDLPWVLDHARAILAAARDLSDCALALLHQNKLQEQRREMAKQREELEQLRKK